MKERKKERKKDRKKESKKERLGRLGEGGSFEKNIIWGPSACRHSSHISFGKTYITISVTLKKFVSDKSF